MLTRKIGPDYLWPYILCPQVHFNAFPAALPFRIREEAT
jgi:hypothetical protein